MVEAIALHRQVVLATPEDSQPDPAGLHRLPDDWTVVDGIVPSAGPALDHVVVGPNGLFTVTIDQTAQPAEPGDDGIYRNGARVTEPVKSALLGAHRLRRDLGEHLFAYPILITPVTGSRHQLDRLGVVPGDRIAEFIWAHPGRPLRRSQRIEALWSLRRLSR